MEILRFLALLTVFLAASTGMAADDAWVGRKVFLRSDAKPEVNGAAVDVSRLASPATVTEAKEGWVYLGIIRVKVGTDR